MSRVGRGTPNGLLAALLAVALAVSASVALPRQGVAAQDAGCNAEAEPNNELKTAPSLAGDICVSGTLPDDDQDLWLWEVDPEGSLLTWTFTIDGVPSTITSIHVLQVSSAPGVEPITVGTEMLRVDSRADSRDTGVTTDVHLDPGRYLLGISRGAPLGSATPSSLGYHATITRTGTLPPSGDLEPNEDAAHASPVSGAYEVSGDLQDSVDEYAWTLTADDATHTWELGLRSPVGSALYETLVGPDGQQLATVKVGPDGLAVLHDLRLAAGTYTVSVTPSATDAMPYVLHSELGTAPGVDPEPDDDRAHAVPLDPGGGVASGRLAAAGDRDDYLLHIDDTLAATQLDIHLMAGGAPAQNHELCLVDSRNVELQCRHGKGDLRLSGLLLPTGDYIVDLTGDASLENGYQLAVEPVGPPVAERETEPNDVVADAASFDPSVEIHGRADGGDDDYFHVAIPGDVQLWRMDASGTGIDSLDWVQRTGQVLATTPAADDGTSASLTDLYLIPGDHWFHVAAHDGQYALRLTPLGPPAANGEREANDDGVHAEPLAIDQARIGRLPDAADVDVYRFSLEAREHVLIELAPPADGAISLGIESRGTSIAELDQPAVGTMVDLDTILEPGDHEVWLRPVTPSDATYSITIRRVDPFTKPGTTAAALPATLTLTPSATEVAGYLSTGQQVDAPLSITNTGSTDLVLGLDAVTSHYLWSASFAEPTVTVPAGATVSVPVTIIAQPDAWTGVPVRISVRARSADGAQATASVSITPTQDATPVHPVVAWALPAALLGGLDVASPAVGGVPVLAFGPSAELPLYDGLAMSGSGFSGQIPSGSGLELTVDLAGEVPIPVAGIVLDPLGGDGTLAASPRAFELLLSADGIEYQAVLSTEMSPLTIEQSFVLDAPVPARFARLRIISSWGAGGGPVTLGEWKVVAAPGSVPGPEPLNIADPVRGGHVVWMEPQAVSPDTAEGLLSEDPTPLKTYLPAGTPVHWITGFQDDRAAQVTSLEWVDPPGSDPLTRFGAVDVEVSLTSPLGPWQEVGPWQLDRGADGSVMPFTFAAPTWARYVRVGGQVPAGDATYWEMPSTFRVLERPTDDSYRSVVGEWGMAQTTGIYERLAPPDLAPLSDAADDDDTAATANPLSVGAVAQGRVHRPDDVDWFSLTVPDGQNTVNFELGGSPFVRAGLSMTDQSGAAVALDRSPTYDPAVDTYTAIVTPGSTYDVEVEQLPSSVAVTYDTSASLGDDLAFVAEALRSFAADVVPGNEAMQVTPFEQESLLSDWSDVPYVIENAVDGAVNSSGSSSIETAMLQAVKLLSTRAGTRAMLVMSDGETGSYTEGTDLWQKLGSTRPVVFTVHVGGHNDPALTTHLMQDWAAAGGGTYQYAASHGQIDRAFDRMATQLRRPAPYTLSFSTSHQDLPPGSVRVTSPTGSTPVIGGDVAIELVLDTSGSMRNKIGKRTRIEIAKAVLGDLVANTLPAGIPVALRTFKAGGKNCGTVLPVPLGPLDPTAMGQRIADIQIDKRTKTPLGAALHAVGSDLASVPGPTVVILVTDGQETCKGDAGVEIQALLAAGLDVQVNIVGFAIDDAELQADIARWAELGHGASFQADDAKQLGAAIAKALAAPFRVHDPSGAIVGSGTVGGDAVSLEPGRYRVEVLTDPVATFDIVVGVGEDIEVKLDAPAP